MINKMNRNMLPETPLEIEIENLLREARRSKELINFAEELREDIKEIEAPFYSYRVKKVHSAIRTFRIANHQKIEDLHDLFGILIVVENEKDIKKVAQKIIKKLEEPYLQYNLLKERDWIEQKEASDEIEQDLKEGHEQILADLKRVFSNTENLEKVLPPFSYIITSNLKMENRTIPVEFRIQSKTGFHIVESAYFTIYKNDEVDPKIKAPILFITHQLINRKIKIDTNNNITEEEKAMLINEMGELQLHKDNLNLLCENRDIILDVWREYAKIATKYELHLPVYDFHFFGKKQEDPETMEKIENRLDQIFEQFKSFDLRKIDTKSYIKYCIHILQEEGLI